MVDFENFDEEIIKNIKTASSLKITGEAVESEGKGQTGNHCKKLHNFGDNFSKRNGKLFFNRKALFGSSS